MTNTIKIKEFIFLKINQILDEKINSARQAIQSAKESRDSETKSSVGDKYETGRTMMQIELEKSRVQLNKALKQKNELSKINLQEKHNTIKFGSLVHSSAGNYFISIGTGKIEIEDRIYYSVSMVSPIGKILINKKIGNKMVFQGKEIAIIEIV